MKNYTFQVLLGGCGNTPEEAWANMQESVDEDGLGPYDAMDTLIVAEEDMDDDDE